MGFTGVFRLFAFDCTDRKIPRMKHLSRVLPSSSWLRVWALSLSLSLAAPILPAQSNTVTLNFVNADIGEVARAIAVMTGRNLVVDPRVKGNLNIVSDKPVSTSAAYDQFLSAVRLQGYTVVETAGIYKLVPEADAKLQSNTLIGGGVGSDAKSPSQLRGNQIATQVFTLNYENANNMASVLRPLMGQGSSITINPSNNSLIITDYADNLQRAAKLIASQDISKGTDLEVIPLRNASAVEIAPLIVKLSESGMSSGGNAANAPMILADSRSNAIIVRAGNPVQLTQIRSLVQSLDRDFQGGSTTDAVTSGVYVVKLKSGDASKIAATLRAVLPAGLSANGQAAATSNVQIQADAATNSLIITAPDAQYRQLKAVIDKIDARPAQVFIESLIAEVNTNRLTDFGIQWQGASGKSGDTHIGVLGTNFGAGMGNIIGAATTKSGAVDASKVAGGLNFGVFRKTGGVYVLGMLANFLETTGDGNILATPNVLTLDNEESRVIVGQNVPFVTGSYQQNNNSVSNPFQTIERKDVGMTLRVKPQINEDGSIKLKIFQEISNVDPASKNDPAGLITNKRSFETNVIVDDGAIVVLGGLLQDEYTDGQSKVPLLGDIPGVGSLFKSQNRVRKKTNLMVFIRPTVLRDEAATTDFSTHKYDDMRNKQQALQPGRHLIFENKPVPNLPEIPAVTPPLDMNMTQGLPQTSLKLSNSLPPAPSAEAGANGSPLDKLYRQNLSPSNSLRKP
jgi:general secretion pathway protein D